MDDSDSPLKYNPFGTLGELLKDKVVLRPVPIKRQGVSTKEQVASTKKTEVSTTDTEPAEACAQPVNEESAFREAMEGVKPVVKDKHHAKENNVANPPDHPVLDHLVNEPEQDVRQYLDKLVKYGEGFIVGNRDTSPIFRIPSKLGLYFISLSKKRFKLRFYSVPEKLLNIINFRIF